MVFGGLGRGGTVCSVPDPFVRDTDSRIRIGTKMLRIGNTGGLVGLIMVPVVVVVDKTKIIEGGNNYDTAE